MGFLLTLLYAALNQLSLVDMVPRLAPHRVFFWIAVFAIPASLPIIVRRGFPHRASQVYLMLGLILAVGASRASHLWLGGVLPGVVDFLTSAIIFYLVLANVNTLGRIRIVAAVTTLVCLYLLAHSVLAYYRESPDHRTDSRWLIYQWAKPDPSTGEPRSLPRIRALGLLKDPNDFAQFLLVTLPFIGLAWRPWHPVRNLLIVLLPACFVLYGIYLTHSRGAFVGLAVVLSYAVRNRFGRVAGVAVAVLLVAVIFLLGNPREAMMNDPSTGGRLMAWGVGISLLREFPVFGAGYNVFLEHSELTAHNSFVLCFAELGLFGYCFWVGLIVSTVIDLNDTIRSIYGNSDNAELLRCAEAIRLSLFAFLATAWFLSRTYTITLYLLLGMAVALVHLGRKTNNLGEAASRAKWPLTVALQAVSIAAVYVTIRLRAL